MSKEEFEDWVVKVHESLFHVSETVLDDTYGVRLDQVIVIRMINDNPAVLKHQTLRELLDMFDVL